MIDFSKDWEGLAKAMEPYKEDWVGFDPQSLVEDEDNILLNDGSDNYALFEFDRPGVYFGHYLFGSARGRDAYRLARKMLEYVFTHYDVVVVKGQTPLNNKGALWMNRKLGFQSIGTVQTEAGPCDLVFITKEGFYK